MATPVIRINNPGAPKDRQQAVVMATKEARLYREKKMVFPRPPQELLNPATALSHAERLLRAEGIPTPSRQQCLGKLVLPFGQYENAPFRWLVENDVGYIKFMLDKHRTEVTNTHRKGPVGNQWVKDHLTEYAESFPEVSALLEANIDRCVYGQKGFEHHTFREMWDLYSQYRTQKDRPEQFSAEQRETIQKAYSSVRRWQNTPVTHILSVQMKRFKKYIRDNEEQLQASTSQSDASSWPGDDAELVAASQAVEDLLKTQESPSGARQEQAEKAVKPQKKAKAADPLPKQPETAVQLLKQAQLQKERQLLKQAQLQKERQLLKQAQQQKQPETADPLPKQSQQRKQPETADPLPKQSQQRKQPEATVQLLKQSQQQKQPEADVQQSPSTSSGQDTGSPLSDSSVELEGWVRLWENPNGIPLADISWLKEDTERGLFTPVQLYKDITGLLKRRRVMKSDRMWFYPPEPPGYVSGGLPTPQLFFRSRVFVWRPVGVWRYSLKCPRGDGCAGTGRNVHLCKSGYHTRVRHICDVSSWYTVVTEVLCCGPCTKAARSKEGGTVGRWLAWDQAILSQLSEAHQAMFPAILTSKRGVDKNVVRLLRERTEGNTMVKVWRQVQESHVEDYLHRKDLYTTILMTVAQPGGIVSAFRQTFQAPPPQRELPSARLLRHAFLLAEANNVQDYRNQILSTFGTVLKMDSTKKVVKKLSGEGHGSAEWFTSIGNEYSQIVSFVLTCEESTQKLEPMCRGVMDRFRLANQPVPKILYVDKGCCRAQGPTAVETLFQPWVDNGMVVRLDIFHWIHRFDAAIRTESHCKYAVFKSAVAGAVLGYNREDLELLIKAVRARDPATMKSLSDEDVVRCYISREQLKHHVRRVTLGAQETFRLIHLAIEELKGPAGLDESGVSLFKTPEAIDEMWAAQQQHLECIQDPPDMSMYRVARTTTINKVDVPFYKALRGSNSLEGFHKSLPHMIPGPHCAARPYQVYLISGIARWNSDRSSDAVFGGKGRHHRTYSAPLIDRLNARCQQLFGETVEDNFRAPADVASNELLGLEYLFNQSTGQSGTFSLQDIVNDGPDAEEEVVQHGQPDPDADEAYESDVEACDNALDADLPHIKLTNDETSTVHPPAFEDACSQNPLPGFQKLENFCSVLVEIGVAEDKLSLSTEQRNKVLDAWNAVEDHDKQQQQFNQLYRTHWGNTLYCRTKRDDLVDAAVIQRLKMAKRYAPAQQDISAQHNRLMYTLVKLLWLRSPQKSHASPEKATILKAYERIQHRILVEDPVLCKAGIPLPKINIKTVRDFIRSQERLLNLRATPQPTTLITKITSVSSAPIPPAPHQPAVLAPPDYPLMQYVPTPSTAGTKVLKARTDTIMPVSRPQPPLPPVLLPPPVRKTPATSTITRPVPSVSATTAMAGIAGTSTQPITPADQTTSRPQTLLPTPPLPLTSAGPSTSAAAAAAAAPPAATSSWSRSTKYKRKLKEQLSGISQKVPRVQTLPVCSTCGQLTQGHKKYKKKSYCPVKRMSSSKGLDKRVYDSYEHFASVVDALVQ